VVIASGWAVTAAHVVTTDEEYPVTRLQVRVHDVWEFCDIVEIDLTHDLARLRLPRHNWSPAPIRWTVVAKGESLWVLGYPWGGQPSASRGVCSAIPFYVHDTPYIQTDALLIPGDSGGGTFDADGYLVGINDAMCSYQGQRTGFGLSVPVEFLRPLMVKYHIQK
jgi:serine protease Do